MINDIKNKLARSLAEATGLEESKLTNLLKEPKNNSFGDLAFPCFEIGKKEQKSPPEAAKDVAAKINLPEEVTEARLAGPFINFLFNRKTFAKSVVDKTIAKTPVLYIEPKTFVIDYSSPNIAKPFHVGHLRTTLIGNSLVRVLKHLGHEVISVNHLGDWGTQFGFVWAGCNIWGKPTEPTVAALVELYRQSTSLRDRQEKNELESGDENYPDVNEIARQYFLDLEAGKKDATEFWQWCLDISLKYLKETYSRLGIEFDHFTGESFYSDKLDDVKKDLDEKNLLVESQGAFGVELEEELGFARILTPDGRSLYLARDIAAVDYRAKEFNFDEVLYVVGSPQALHFQQLIRVLEKLEKDYASNVKHIGFGHVSGMKTRGPGGAIELNEFFDEAFDRALTAYREQVSKRPEGLDENIVADAVSLSAVMFSTLSRTRLKDVQFSWEHALEFQGDSGPYLLYALARIHGMKEKALAAGIELKTEVSGEHLQEDSAFELLMSIAGFGDALEKVVKDYEPAHLATYAVDLAKSFSKAYLDLKVVGADKEVAEERLALFEATRVILQNSIELLGIKTLERM